MNSNRLVRAIEIKDRNGRVIGTKEVVTYQGLLSKAHDEGLVRVATKLIQVPSDENGRTAIAKVLVETTKGHFEALGDASPENVNSFILPHLIRMAETRAKARALRDAVNIGVLSFEELDGVETLPEPSDLGSGTPVPAPRTSRGERKPAAPAVPVSANGRASMTEAQRRYLFRILAGQGISGDAAHDYLTQHFVVESLKDVTKAQATEAIDKFLKTEEVSGGADQR